MAQTNRTQGKAPGAKPTTAQVVEPAKNDMADIKKQEVITRSESAQMAATEQKANLPAYIKQNDKGRGSENVEMADVAIPRIEIVQALSPCLKKNDPGYIPGAEQGMLYNSVTRELYGLRVPVIPIFFKKQYLVWKDRKSGGGFGGGYDTPAEARNRVLEQPESEQDLWQIQDTAQQLVMVVKGDGSTEEAIVSMARTKLKVSKNWNSLIRLNGNDRFSRLYFLFTVDEMNNNGDEYKNFAVANAGFPDELHYKKAEALYTAVASGERKIVMDTSDSGEPEGAGGGTEY